MNIFFKYGLKHISSYIFFKFYKYRVSYIICWFFFHFSFLIFQYSLGVVVVMMVWQLSVQSVSITTNGCEFESRSLRCELDTTLSDKVCQWLAAGRYVSPGTPVTDRHDITEILFKVPLNIICLYLSKSFRICYPI